ncbi:MAG: hypothetical protein HC827_21795 [Cyanobacteria bacterium RM1_2_2]|nr:hypothetical protein [Cyanobacteria bacterium RM1_2_2]
MPYSDQLSPWVVYRLLPNCQRLLMERFRKRNNAEDYAKVLRQLQPNIELVVVFEVGQITAVREPKPIQPNSSR